MSKINDHHATIWIEENHPENGLFRAYWKDVINNHKGGATLDPDEGEGLRYEWYYKDGLKDGTSRGWYPNGQLKHICTWYYGKLNGLSTAWHSNGQKDWEVIFKDGKEDGLYIEWYENGQKRIEGNYKDGESEGLKTYWHENGEKTDKL
jgi:antitoxin component YwqK of YwqJK toxin-antitoxin module